MWSDEWRHLRSANVDGFVRLFTPRKVNVSRTFVWRYSDSGEARKRLYGLPCGKQRLLVSEAWLPVTKGIDMPYLCHICPIRFRLEVQ